MLFSLLFAILSPHNIFFLIICNILMKKAHKIIYRIATVWLSLGMLSAGIVQVMKMQAEIDLVTHLGYPIYFLMILWVSKILGIITILAPKFPILKEWAYAGFTFTMIGAIVSHLAVGDGMMEIFPAILLLVLTLVSWYFRPASRRVATSHK